MTTRKHHTAAALTLTALALAATSAQAAVIYQDDFSGDGTANLAGTTPDTTTGGNTWIASTDWKNDGSLAGAVNAGDNAFLAFTPSTGTVYTLTVSLATPSGSTNATAWGAVGFTADNLLTDFDFWQSTNNASPWVLYRQNTQVVTLDGPGVSGTNTGVGNFSGPITYSIVLDTTIASDWTAQWLVNGTEVRPAESIGTPTINYVGLGGALGADVDFSSFSLEVIPEPSAVLLGGFGLLALLRRRR